MAISNNKTRILITLPFKDKELLEKVAKKENRSVSNYVYTLILKDLDDKQKHL